MQPIDPDDRRTWPIELKKLVEHHSDRLAGTTELASELDLTSFEKDFRTAAGRGIVAYHSTRLIATERASVFRDGLKILSADLIAERIAGAERSGELSAGLAERVRVRSVVGTPNANGNRFGRVCFVIGRGALEDDGLIGFQSVWGGEAINGGPIDPNRENLTSGIGDPTIVTASVPVGPDTDGVIIPGLANVFVGTYLGLRDPFAELHHFAHVPASAILDIWQPEPRIIDV